MDDKQYDKELKGFLWHETGSTVIRKGTMQINGEEIYSAIVKTKVKGEDKYELMVSAGLLHLNEEKKSERSPDIVVHNLEQCSVQVWWLEKSMR